MKQDLTDAISGVLIIISMVTTVITLSVVAECRDNRADAVFVGRN